MRLSAAKDRKILWHYLLLLKGSNILQRGHRGMGRYFVTFNVTVFEIALPFFGVTVTVTLHEPTFKPLRVVPDTLQ
jgi:hypothetical protein